MSQLLNFLASDLGSIALLSLFFLISSISKFKRKKDQRASENKKKLKDNDSFIDIRKEILEKQLKRKKEQEISSSSNLETKFLKAEEKAIIEAHNLKLGHKAERSSSENAIGKSDQSGIPIHIKEVGMRALKLLLLELCIREAKWVGKHPNS